MFGLDMIVGSGGVLSHAPQRQQAMLMMIDAFQPEGITRLAVDSIFMMPQLGVLAQVNQEAATQVFERDCLVHLGTCIAPVGAAKPRETCLSISVEQSEKETIIEDVPFGQLRLYPLGVGQNAKVSLQPDRRFDVGADRGTSCGGRGDRGCSRFGRGYTRPPIRGFARPQTARCRPQEMDGGARGLQYSIILFCRIDLPVATSCRE